jgi:integrase
MAKAGVDPCYTKRGKNKVPGKSFHSFRHTMVTNLESRQIAETVRMRMVGHANANVHRIYSHDDWGAITSAINGLPSISA